MGSNSTCSHRCPSFLTWERGKFNLYIQPSFLAIWGTFWLSRSITILQLRRSITFESTKHIHSTRQLDFLCLYVCRPIGLVNEPGAQNCAIVMFSRTLKKTERKVRTYWSDIIRVSSTSWLSRLPCLFICIIVGEDRRETLLGAIDSPAVEVALSHDTQVSL